ncbi:SOS response-associated peptidase [Rhizobium rhizophilum]|uniref:SOS response-associated peptidase n=1 Tax=Rhizobium rhizophilum TaxID=1850373 RepID=A0ABY2QN10_9HYPH|nr:SOS response-associated peptidase [Rhizobium rhizophilum]THV10557.1 SOS response-associated peptidase [Rhizobium rhizophilum]
MFFALRTCEANEVVKPMHQKAMPTILTKEEEVDTWLRASWTASTGAKGLQRPLTAVLKLRIANGNPHCQTFLAGAIS